MIQMISIVIAVMCIAVAGASAAVLRELKARLDAAQARLAELEARGSDGVASEAMAHLANHDLRAPVATILGYQELLSEGALGSIPDQADDAVARIGIAARQLLTLLDGYFAVQHADAGRLPVSVEPTLVSGVIEAALETSRALAAEYGATIRVSVPEHVAPLQTDPEQLECALDLAFTAAVRASPKASIAIDLRSGPERSLVLTVSGTRIRAGERTDEGARTGAEIPEESATTRATAPAREEDREAAAPSASDADVKRSNARLYLADRLLTALGSELALEPASDGTTTLVLYLRPAPSARTTLHPVPR